MHKMPYEFFLVQFFPKVDVCRLLHVSAHKPHENRGHIFMFSVLSCSGSNTEPSHGRCLMNIC